MVRRCLASVGWFDGEVWTPSGRAALRHRDHLVEAGRFLARFPGSAPDVWKTPWDAETADAFSVGVRRLGEWQAGIEQDDLVAAHLEGALLVPTVLAVRAREGSDRLPPGVERLLALLGWIDGGRRWIPNGRTFREFSDHYGLAGSYLPLLARLEELLRGDLVVSRGGDEWHCERMLNAETDSAARRRYFADADPIFREVFAYGRPPAFIADMGCGDGSWLAHLHHIVGDGVRYVGIDASPVALDAARQKLLAAGVATRCCCWGTSRRRWNCRRDWPSTTWRSRTACTSARSPITDGCITADRHPTCSDRRRAHMWRLTARHCRPPRSRQTSWHILSVGSRTSVSTAWC